MVIKIFKVGIINSLVINDYSVKGKTYIMTLSVKTKTNILFAKLPFCMCILECFFLFFLLTQ